MYTKNQLVVFIASIVIVFVLGLMLGIAIKPQQSPAVQTKVEAATNLSSKVVSSITAYGKVSGIQGRDLTLSSLGDDLVVTAAPDARIYSFDSSSKQQITQFESIKAGDNVNVALKLLPNGKLQGTSIIILPVPTTSK